jgi:hypothetical protein
MKTTTKIPSFMIDELKKTYISQGLGTFEKALFHLSSIDSIAKDDLERIERIVKLDCFTQKLNSLALAYLDDVTLLNKLYINLELKYLNISKTTFIELVNELKTNNINTLSK